MTARLIATLTGILALSACGEGGTTASSRRPAFIPPPVSARSVAGLDKVMGRDARSLVQMFGTARQDVREDGARKLQFANEVCILDAYLYPPAKGKTAVVSYVTARVPDGRSADPAPCVTSLGQR
jgi:hypothetical protein